MWRKSLTPTPSHCLSHQLDSPFQQKLLLKLTRIWHSAKHRSKAAWSPWCFAYRNNFSLPSTPRLSRGFLKVWREERGPWPSRINVLGGRLHPPTSHEYRKDAKTASMLVQTEQILCKGKTWELSFPFLSLTVSTTYFLWGFLLVYKIPQNLRFFSNRKFWGLECVIFLFFFF